jgi:type III secretory pathway component EscT
LSDILLGVIGGLVAGLLFWIAATLGEISGTLKDIKKEKLH